MTVPLSADSLVFVSRETTCGKKLVNARTAPEPVQLDVGVGAVAGVAQL